jgi:hypothetical protein
MTETVVVASDGVTLSFEYVSPDDRVLIGATNESSAADALVSRVAGSLTTDVDGSAAGIFNEHICYLAGTRSSAENLQAQLNKGQSIFITLAGAGTVNLFFLISSAEIPSA